MNVSRARILKNGLKGRCPNCGGSTLFEGATRLKVNPACTRCGLKFEKGDGAFLGPLVINYAITAFGCVIPLIVLFSTGHLGVVPTVVLCALSAIALPLFLYRWSWALWLMLYYFVMPGNLPANLGGRPEDDE